MVTKHRGNIRRVSTLEFYVQYEIDYSWEWNSWKNLRSNTILHEYLRNKKLQNLILECRYYHQQDIKMLFHQIQQKRIMNSIYGYSVKDKVYS